ncbi:MAG TPA: alpha/beta hydrolase-fold protein, partial [Chitinophagaceae bacterium]|nr:alpha/beta hydrolase-fold protein [Chitinophagaceae bacterium]
MKKFLLPVAVSLCTGVYAQYSVHIKLQPLSSKASAEEVYLAGSFNGWNPKDETFRLRKDDKGNFSLLLRNIPAGTYEYKFTKGGWETVETDANGQNIGNRTLKLSSDTTIAISIAGWSMGVNAVKKETASANVRIIDTSFYIPQLKRSRRIWVYLPPDYSGGTKKYPVLYMHDGQNLFNEATSYAGEWGVDETLDSMKKQCIVIGIDNGLLKRMNEYNPYNNERFGPGEGRQYIDFIAKTLKPYIDKKYRTLKDRNNTIIAGSSMGGLISMYAAVIYPRVFGAAGVFSPSFWISPKLKDDINKLVKPSTHRQSRIYFYAGEQESKE